MIIVTIGTNTNRNKVTVDPSRTLKSVLDEQEIQYATATLHMDGASLKPGDLNKTFAELGVTGEEGKDACYLIAVVKAENAQ